MQDTLQEIIRRISKGDQDAFRRVVEHYQRPAFPLVFRILAGIKLKIQSKPYDHKNQKY
ncbi:MAG: hypothetical protein H8D67_22190 [Deltaproteobacteria bacterium]|nr:hypothetical protein [Deltaproteobacteria bacterium]